MQQPRALLRRYEDRCRELGYLFSPLVFEDTGFVHSSVHAVLHQLSGSDNFQTSTPEFYTWAVRKPEDYWYQALSCSLVAGNAQVFRQARLTTWFDSR